MLGAVRHVLNREEHFNFDEKMNTSRILIILSLSIHDRVKISYMMTLNLGLQLVPFLHGVFHNIGSYKSTISLCSFVEYSDPKSEGSLCGLEREL